MVRRILLVCLGMAVVGVCGCGNAKKPPVPVKGMVNLDGKPMADGEIAFVLSEGGSPVNLPVKDGSFSGNVQAGKNRVEVRAYKTGPALSTDPTGAPTKVNYIPDRFNSKSTLDADVPAGGASDLKFDVTSR